MKKLYLILLSFLFISSTFAFEPSQSLKSKMAEINKKVEKILQNDPTKIKKLETAIEALKFKYIENERALYILWEIEKIAYSLDIYTSDGKVKLNSPFFSEKWWKIYIHDKNGSRKETVIWDFTETWYNISSNEKIDYDSFKELSQWFAKDKNWIYYCLYSFCKKLENIDKNTFEQLNNYYYKDKDYVYMNSSSYIPYEILSIITGADSSSFEVLNESYYAKDKNHVYMNWIINKNLDSATFEILEKSSSYTFWETIAKDKNGVYCCNYNKCEILSNIDQNSVQTFEYWGIIKDKNGVYYIWFYDDAQKIENSDLDKNSFEVLNHYYGKDKNHVYSFWDNTWLDFDVKIIDWADASTFKVIKDRYSKDKNHVYMDWIIVPYLDASSFTIFPLDTTYMNWNTIAKDKNGVYFNGSINKDIDVNSFEILNYNYYKDENSIYYWDTSSIGEMSVNIVDFWNIKNFQLIYGLYNGEYAKDTEYVYYKWKIILEADPHSFEVMEFYHYAKDTNNVYIEGELLKNADPDSFEILYTDLSKDKRFVYIWKKIIDWVDMDTFKYIWWFNFEDKDYDYRIIQDFNEDPDEEETYTIVKTKK